MSIKLPKKRTNFGNKKWEPTAEDLLKVEQLAAIGLSDMQIAHQFGWFPTSMGARKWHNPEFEQAILKGRSTGVAVQAQAVFNRGQKGSTIDSLFWLKCVGGWNERRGEQDAQQQQQNQQPNIQIIVPQVYKDSKEWTKAVQIEQEMRAKDTEEKLAIEMKEQGLTIVDVEVDSVPAPHE